MTSSDASGGRLVTPVRPSSLEQLLKDPGGDLLQLLRGDLPTAEDVKAAVIYDAAEPAPSAGAIVLAVGVRAAEEIVAVVERSYQQGAAAVVLRTPLPAGAMPALEDALGGSGFVVLGLAAGTSFTQLSYLLSTSLGVRSYLRSDLDVSAHSGVLRALANQVSELVDAPVLIEDRSARVMAFSSRQEEADQARADTIVGGVVPVAYTRAYQASGVLTRLYNSTQPLFIPPVADQSLPRVAVAVRAGNEILGSLWAAVRGPLDAEQEEGFADAAKLVALHLLRTSVTRDVRSQFKAERILTLIEGGASTSQAARALGIAQPAVVWAWGFPSASLATSYQAAEAGRARAVDALAFHVGALHPSAAVATLADTAYAVVPVPDSTRQVEESMVAAAQRLLDRSAPVIGGNIGVSRVARDARDVARARRDADRALRVLQERRQEGVAGGITSLNMDGLLLELRDLAGKNEHRPSAAVQRLATYDRERNTQLIPTLRTWLDAFGDVRAGAQAMRVHANTFRYRMRRVVEVGRLDLDDLAGRFALMIELRLLGLGDMATGAAGPD